MCEMDIRGAMDRRLSALDASSARRTRIREKVKVEEPVQKTIRLGLVLAVIALLMLGGAAVASSTLQINLFSIFDERGFDRRYKDIVDQATVYDSEPVRLDVEGLGEVEISFACSYFDGERIEFGCAIEGRARVENYTPTEEERAAMVLASNQEWALSLLRIERKYVDIYDACTAAVENGEPCGFHYIYVDLESENYNADTGERLQWTDGVSFYYSTDSIFSHLRTIPLKEPTDEQSLRITIPIRCMDSFYWFDGKEWYHRTSRRIVHEETIVVTRTDAQ